MAKARALHQVQGCGENKVFECRSCARDVRRGIARARVALHWVQEGGEHTKSKLIGFHVLCSELCARRLVREAPFKKCHLRMGLWWSIEKLAEWVGPDVFQAYEDLHTTCFISPSLRKELPAILHALSHPILPPVVATAPSAVDEEPQAVSQSRIKT